MYVYSQFRCDLKVLLVKTNCTYAYTKYMLMCYYQSLGEPGNKYLTWDWPRKQIFSVVICLEERLWFLCLLQLSLMITDTCRHSLTKSFLGTVRALISWFPVESSIGVFQLCSSESQNSKVATQRWLWDKKGDFGLFTSVSEGRAQTFYLFDMSEFYLMFCLKNSKGNGLLQLL